jgi:hypothetical protein
VLEEAQLLRLNDRAEIVEITLFARPPPAGHWGPAAPASRASPALHRLPRGSVSQLGHEASFLSAKPIRIRTDSA